MFNDSGFSRLPVYSDDTDDIIGFIHIRDFNKYVLTGKQPISSIIKKTVYIAKQMQISELLKLMQQKKTHMAVVADEFGGTLGLVTLEDVIEELVGEIWDEHDEEEVFLRKLGPDAYAVDAAMDFDDFAAYFHLKTDSEKVSVSGWDIEQFGRLPEAGDSFTFDGLRVEVTRVENHRIEEIHVERETPKATA